MSNKNTEPTKPKVILQAAPKVWLDGCCHCGTVTFKVHHAPLDDPDTRVLLCDCSICTANGYLLIYPERSEIQWSTGWELMRNYRYYSKTRDHKFCAECGSSVCIDFLGQHGTRDDLGLNVRLLRDVDLDNLKYHRVSNKDL